MILTCPQCDTKYVVKDGAIPPAGRQVRCASCKHSWHQQGDDAAAQADIPAEPRQADEMGGPPVPGAGDHDAAPAAEAPEAAAAPEGIGIAPPQSEDEVAGPPADAAPASTNGLTDPSTDVPDEATAPTEDLTDDYAAVPLSQTMVGEEPQEDFAVHGFDEDDAGERSGRLFKTILVLLAAVGIAVAAFWYLAPQDWRARVGLAAADRSPLKIMLDTRDRQKLESGNELLAISGRILNPTDEEQPVPAIRAELRNRQSQQLVHSWIIRPQSRVLPPHGTTSFNSAEIDVPQGGDDISLSLGAD